MSTTMSYHCSSSPMEEHKTDNLWSECFQDLGSWCHQPQDELNTPIINNQNEFNFGFDDQSMYHWEANSSSVEFKSEMWKPQADLLPLQFTSEEDNNNSLIQTQSNKSTKEGIRYSGNLVLTQCPLPDIDEDTDQNDFKSVNWNEITENQGSPNIIQPSLSTKRNELINNSFIETEAIIKKPKAALKLNIEETKTPSVTDITPFEVNTPDVLNSLVGGSDFSLLSFVCDGYEENLPEPPKKSSEEPVKIDHDYAEPLPDEEPFLCHNLEPTKIEDETLQVSDEEDSKAFPLAVKEEPCSPSPSTSLSLGKRIRKCMADEDFIYDDDPPSDQSSDWSPSAKKRSKTSKKKNSESKITKRSRTSSFSDSGSVTSGPDRYRELRDRNNEASRRSRMNRKQREVEMMEQSDFLQKENLHLKIKAENLEKRVKSLREILLKVVLGKNKNSI